MLLKILHQTSYRYDRPIRHGLFQLRLHPKSGRGQEVRSWSARIEGGTREVTFMDQFDNQVDLVSAHAHASEVVVTGEGEVEVKDSSGIFGDHRGNVPLWLYTRETEATRPGSGIRQLAEAFSAEWQESPDEGGDITFLHAMSAKVLSRISYRPGTTDPTTRAEDALAAGTGVCQDHAHVFLAASRCLGFPARYVSGYLESGDSGSEQAGHAWAEVHVKGLGWVGFDVSNGISPDDRYVRVATGLDCQDAAPVRGMRLGDAAESMTVSLQVTQQ
ncbi:MAG: transglutaminase family protein [Boseongicola sp. SB0676_bin_33]|nr:transglutaminase family protein [Boseongicola sp. SB0676_bin_33]